MTMENGRHPLEPEMMEKRRMEDHEIMKKAREQAGKVELIKNNPCGSYEINGGKKKCEKNI